MAVVAVAATTTLAGVRHPLRQSQEASFKIINITTTRTVIIDLPPRPRFPPMLVAVVVVAPTPAPAVVLMLVPLALRAAAATTTTAAAAAAARVRVRRRGCGV